MLGRRYRGERKSPEKRASSRAKRTKSDSRARSRNPNQIQFTYVGPDLDGSCGPNRISQPACISFLHPRTAHHRARPITRERPVTCVQPETRERSYNPRLDLRPLHTRRSLIVACGTSAAQLQQLNRLGDSFSAPRLIRLRKSISSPFVTIPTLRDLVSAVFKEPTTNRA